MGISFQNKSAVRGSGKSYERLELEKKMVINLIWTLCM